MEEAGGTLPWSLRREPSPASTFVLDFGLRNWEKVHFFCSKPPAYGHLLGPSQGPDTDVEEQIC